MDLKYVQQRFEQSIITKRKCLDQIGDEIVAAGQAIVDCLEDNHTAYFCGNGGSAADAQHFAAELIVKLKGPRRPLPALALTTDTSVLTAIGNDFNFDEVFSRQLEGLAQKNDILVASSTTGNSHNIVRAVQAAQKLGVVSIGLLGRGGGDLRELVDYPIVVPAEDTARIQECHLLIGHIWMEMADDAFTD